MARGYRAARLSSESVAGYLSTTSKFPSSFLLSSAPPHATEHQCFECQHHCQASEFCLPRLKDLNLCTPQHQKEQNVKQVQELQVACAELSSLPSGRAAYQKRGAIFFLTDSSTLKEKKQGRKN
ncbi:unnamed protein product [Closterium sp. Naga37s-1]|nr:unnamed protein product [Closterium sp. Naga37s-1]